MPGPAAAASRGAPVHSDDIPVLVDCDNTMGEYRNEIDDGLALIMLLAAGVDLVGVTTTFGNGPVATVHRRTRSLLDALGRADVPVVRGAAFAGDRETPAAQFIADAARRHRGRLRILAIGPLTNLAAALGREPAIDGLVHGVYTMGGYLRPLRFLRREVDELNLSADPEAAHAVLSAGWPVTLMSAQLCLQARYGVRHLLAEWIRTSASPAFFRRSLRRTITGWFAAFSIHVGAAGFYLWDLVPAWALLDPSRFVHRTATLLSTQEDLARGVLRLQDAAEDAVAVRSPGVIDVPRRIRRGRRFAADCAEVWRSNCHEDCARH